MAPVSARRGKTVLCIGNEPVSLNFRCSLLKENGWKVLSSASGHEGVLRFQRKTVDAVVLDLNDHGTEAALIISALKKIRPEVRVVMLVSDEEELVPGATNQADAVLPKSQEAGRLQDVLVGLTRRH
jgi:DNA-binding response OmpR family regulator